MASLVPSIPEDLPLTPAGARNQLNAMEDKVEDYWSSSRVTYKKQKVNIFDDNVTVEAASDIAKLRKSLADEEDDDYSDTINWDDTPVQKPHTEPVPASRPPARTDAAVASRPSTGSGASARSLPKYDPIHSSQPPPRPADPSYMTHSRSRSDVLVGSMGKMTVSKASSIPDNSSLSGQEPSIAASTERPQKTVTRKPASRLEEENQFLQAQLEMALKQGGGKVDIDTTIKRMTAGQYFQLEPYKSLAEKLALLDKAIATHDGNAIVTAVIFLRQTVKQQIFNIELTRRPEAVGQYLAYLRAHYDLHELEYLLGMLGRTEEVAMLRYKQAISVQDPQIRIERLKTCLGAHFQHNADLEHEAGLIQQQIDLLHRQRPVEVSDAMSESEGKNIIMKKIPRAASIINMPVITTLFYLCLYHYDEPENLLSSPAAVRQQHQLSEKQYVWTAVRARARLGKWGDIERLLTTKGWFGGTKLKAVIGFEKIAAILHKAGAPSDVTAKYLMLVEDVDKRLKLGYKMQCHNAIIDTFIAQRDRRSLQEYHNRTKAQSQEWFYSRDALSSSTVKWKT